MTLAEIRTKVKDLITHSPSGIDTTVDTGINSAIEFMTHVVSAIYDEEVWEHQFDAADVSSNYDNWLLPSNVQHIRTAAYRDVSGAEDVYTPLEIISPDDRFRYNEKDRGKYGGDFMSAPNTDFSGDINFGIFESYSNRNRVGRVDSDGEPRLVYRLQDNVFTHPRPSSAEVGNYLELFLIKYCAELTADGQSNNLTIKFPYAVIHYAVGILWATKFNNLPRAQASIQLAASMLQGIANKQELNKLINITSIIGA